MTLVILGLLLKLAGIVWVIVLDIVWKDRQCQGPGLHKFKRT